MTIEKEIQELQQKAGDLVRSAALLRQLQEAFPDIEKHVGRFGWQVYASASVNAQVTDCDIRHSCKCCHDSPLKLHPYIQTEHGKVYSNPSTFVIGERRTYDVDSPKAGWKQLLRDAGIPEIIVQQAEKRFTDQKALARERLEASFEEMPDDEVESVL